MERLNIGSGVPKTPLAPMEFDPKAYEALKAKLDDVRKDLQAFHEDSEYKALIKKVSEERTKAKMDLAAQQQAKRQAMAANVDDVFDVYNAQFEAKFRKYKMAPVMNEQAAPVSGGPAFADTTNQSSFESKWVQPKDPKDDLKKTAKKGWFRGLFGKDDAPTAMEEVTTPKINQRINKTPEGKAMPHWAKVALSKVMEVDQKVLKDVKSESLGNPRVVPVKLTPSFAVTQPESQIPARKQPSTPEKKGFFSAVTTGASNLAKGAWKRLFG